MSKIPNIYRYTNKQGQTRYSVCHWVESANQYQVPHDAEEQRVTGCHTSFSRTPEELGEMKRGKAYYEARKLYGYAKIDPDY